MGEIIKLKESLIEKMKFTVATWVSILPASFQGYSFSTCCV